MEENKPQEHGPPSPQERAQDQRPEPGLPSPRQLGEQYGTGVVILHGPPGVKVGELETKTLRHNGVEYVMRYEVPTILPRPVIDMLRDSNAVWTEVQPEDSPTPPQLPNPMATSTPQEDTADDQAAEDQAAEDEQKKKDEDAI